MTIQFSSTVKLTLVIDDKRIELASIGPTEIVLRTPVELPPCDAVVEMAVDAGRHGKNLIRWMARLPDGARMGQTQVRIEDRKR